MERSTRDDVAVFVDFENVYVSVREKFDATPNFELIMDRCEDYGRIVIARAYADWYRYPRVTSALFANGVEPMYVPTYYYDRDVGRTGRPIKNSVDIHLCIDAMRTLYNQPNICKFVLVTGDRDFIPLVNAIRQHGKDVIVIGIGGAASAHLAQSADEFLFYEQIADLKSVPAGRGGDDGRKGDDRRETRERPERPPRAAQPKAEAAPPPAEASPEPPQPVAPEPIVAEPQRETPAESRSPYDTLVDAVKLARQRGFVVNLGSLKVVMRELDSNFHESKVKDANGKGFSKFKDFVKEAERQARVQIFTNGTLTEVFLPGEDPYRMSQFAEDLASEQAERELETELEQEAQKVDAEPTAAEAAPRADEPSESEQEEELAAAIGVTEEPVPASFGEREWLVFRSSMSQFAEPVRFAEIFNALRGLRNQEVVELTNNELKELVKQAINRGMLQRTGRGARAYYRLSSQYRVTKPETPAPETGLPIGEATTATEAVPGGSPQAPRRRARLYGVLPTSEAAATVADGTATEPTAVQETPVEPAPPPAEPETTPSPAPRRRARRKPAEASGNGQNGSGDTPAPSAEEKQPVAASGSRTSSRRRTAAKTEGAETERAPDSGEDRDNGARKRRRRKKPAADEDATVIGEA